MFIRVYNRFAVVKNLNKTLLSFESFLLIGNLTIVALLIIYALSRKSLREIWSQKIKY